MSLIPFSKWRMPRMTSERFLDFLQEVKNVLNDFRMVSLVAFGKWRMVCMISKRCHWSHWGSEGIRNGFQISSLISFRKWRMPWMMVWMASKWFHWFPLGREALAEWFPNDFLDVPEDVKDSNCLLIDSQMISLNWPCTGKWWPWWWRQALGGARWAILEHVPLCVRNVLDICVYKMCVHMFYISR